MKFPTYSNLESVKAYGETGKLRYLFRGQILKPWVLAFLLQTLFCNIVSMFLHEEFLNQLHTVP